MRKTVGLKITNILILIVAISVALTGCAQLKDKFVRKPKEEKVTSKRYRVVRDYDVHPTLELYTKRYIFWKNWHKELLEVLTDSNHKKKIVAIEQEISSLIDMHNMLVEPKAEELQVYIDELTEMEIKIKKERITLGNETRIRRQLETFGRAIKAKFSYRKMGDFIADDFRTER